MRSLIVILFVFLYGQCAKAQDDISFNVVLFETGHDTDYIHSYSCQSGVTFTYYNSYGEPATIGPDGAFPSGTVTVVKAHLGSNVDSFEFSIPTYQSPYIVSYPGSYEDPNGIDIYPDTTDYLYLIRQKSNTEQTAPYNGALKVFLSNPYSDLQNGYISAWYNSVGTPLTGGTTMMINDLATGNYTATLMNVPCNGQSVTINAFVDPLYLVTDSTIPACEGWCNGEAVISLTAGGQSGGIGDNPIFYNPIYSNTFTDDNNCEGTYDYEYYDITGSNISTSYTINETPVVSASPLVVHWLGTEGPGIYSECTSYPDGTGTIGWGKFTASGGIPPYYYVWTYGGGGAPCSSPPDTSGPMNANDTLTLYGCDNTICVYAYYIHPCVNDNISGVSDECWIPNTFIDGSSVNSTSTGVRSLLLNPVPARDAINLTFPMLGTWYIEIIDLYGRCVSRFTPPARSKTYRQPIELPDGTYLVRARQAGNGKVISEKFAVMR